MSYLFDHQVTPEEINSLSMIMYNKIKALVLNTLHERIKKLLIESLSGAVSQEDVITIHYSCDFNVGELTSELMIMRDKS